MNMHSKRQHENAEEASSQGLSYFPRLVLIILAVLLLVFLGWSLTGGGSISQKQGIQTPPATDTADQPGMTPPLENERPQTGTGGNQSSNPPEEQK